jgi:radical SAM protein with 4Fe4S-binding SPASM domain
MAQMRDYPIVNNQFVVHLTPDGGHIRSKDGTDVDFEKFPDLGWRGRLSMTALHKFNVSAREFLRRCDGSRPYETIVAELQDYFRVDGETVLKALAPFVEQAVRLGHVRLSDSAVPSELRMTGSDAFHVPLHAMIELTDQCNLYCRYCYRNAAFVAGARSEGSDGHAVPLEVMRERVRILAEAGVTVCELTGGEPLMYPHFREIVEFCAARFLVGCIVTNACLITEETADCIAGTRRFLASASLDGACGETVDAVAGVKGTFDRVTAGIARLTARKVVVRAAMTVVRRNAAEIEDTLQLAKRLGASAFTAGPPSCSGRALEHSEELLAGAEICRCLAEVQRVTEKYGHFIAQTPPEMVAAHEKIGNCGAGHRSVSIDPRGNVGWCVVDGTGASHLGNLDKDSWRSIVDNDKARFFRHLKWPDSEFCAGCEMERTCRHCVVQGVRAAVERKWDCAWAKQQGVEEALGDALADSTASAGCSRYHS